MHFQSIENRVNRLISLN